MLNTIYHLRGYNYSFHGVPWSEDYPVYFRNYRGFILDNRRHQIITCEEYDQDPQGNNMAIISGTGTGLGLSFEGEWGVVTNRCEYGSYRGEKTNGGQYPIIVRKSIADFPENGSYN